MLTISQIIDSAIAIEHEGTIPGGRLADQAPLAIERYWNLATKGQRSAIGRHVRAIMGANYEADRDPFNRFLAFCEVCAHGYAVTFPEPALLPISVWLARGIRAPVVGAAG